MASPALRRTVKILNPQISAATKTTDIPPRMECSQCNVIRLNSTAPKRTLKSGYLQARAAVGDAFQNINLDMLVNSPKYPRIVGKIFKPPKDVSDCKTTVNEKVELNEEVILAEKKKQMQKKHRGSAQTSSKVEHHSFEEAIALSNESVKGYMEDSTNLNTIISSQEKTYDHQSAHEKLLDSNENTYIHVDTIDKKLTKTQTASLQDLLPNFLFTKSKTDAKSAAVVNLVSKAVIDGRARSLVEALKKATNHTSQLTRMELLGQHLLQYPEARNAAVRQKAIPKVLQIASKAGQNTELVEIARETLSLLGYVYPVKGRGVRVLTIDGGGTRGLVAVETLKQLEIMCESRIHEMFDYVCGVSTGALIAALVSVFKLPIVEIEELYKKCSVDMFARNRVVGTGKLFLNHAYYDTDLWMNVLREKMGEKTFLQTAGDHSQTKLSVVSSIMNTTTLRNYLFRNYNLPPGIQSHYPGSIQYKLWEAIRASSAAPGYYEECKLADFVHQDGGLLSNNPTAIALHEVKLLWPNTPVQCVISLGNGKYDSTAEDQEMKLPQFTSLKNKIIRFIDSATDTEAVHTVLHDLLPPATYFRLNPYLNGSYTLDEIRPEKWQQMQLDAQMYLRKNEMKLETAVAQLQKSKMAHRRALDWLKVKRDAVS